MHPYATNSSERTDVIFRLFPFTTLVTIMTIWLVGEGAHRVGIDQPIWFQALIGGPSAAGSLVWAYRKLDATWWHVRWMRWLLQITIPDIRGRWRVEGLTSYNAEGMQRETWHADVLIAQTWSLLSVYLQTAHSSSRSLSGSILVEQEGGLPVLIYVYENSPKSIAPPTMLQHWGICRLVLNQTPRGADYLEGSYFSDPKARSNFGTMRLDRA